MELPLNLGLAIRHWRRQVISFGRVVAVSFLLLLSFGAKGSIIASPTTIIDHGTYITDSINRLDWYKFSNADNTLGMSLNEVLASSFYLSGGWSVASGAQVQLLEGQFGWTGDTPFSGVTANAGLTNAMGAYLGFTASHTEPTRLLNFIFARTSDVDQVFSNRTYLSISSWEATLGFAPINADFTDVHTTSRNVDESRPGSGEGVWLVRATAVPEPATIALFALGLAGFGFSRRKSARSVRPFRKWWAAPLAILCAGCGSSYANQINVDADSFAIGTVLSNSFAGVTLSVTGGYSGVVVGMDGYSAFNGRNIATTGTLVFGASPTHPTVPQGWETSSGTTAIYRIFRADFAKPTNTVSIDLIADDDDIGELRAFNAYDELIGVVSTGLIRDTSFTATITTPNSDIAYIMAAGLRGESMFLDNLRFNLIPEPATLALFALGLVGLGFSVRKTVATYRS